MWKEKITRKQFLKILRAGIGGTMVLPYLLRGTIKNVFAQSSSNVYRVTNIPVPNTPGFVWPYSGTRWDYYHSGVDALFDLMGCNGLKIFRSNQTTLLSGTDGLIESDDVVVIKVNSQNLARGLTNSDVVRGVIRRLLDHPDGFTGEIIVADNTHRDSSEGFTVINRSNDDHPNHEQNFDMVAGIFPTDQGYRVSTSHWNAFRNSRVNDYDQGDNNDGFVVYGSNGRALPKFTSVRETRISMRYGIWDGSSYESNKLKVINMPVIKGHIMNTMGATICCKNYVGVTQRETPMPWDRDAMHNEVANGLLGDLLHWRFPVLFIADGIWVNSNENNPWEYDDPDNHRINTMVASVDPIACDTHCAKHILLGLEPSKEWKFDPEFENSHFQKQLLPTYNKLMTHGRHVNWGEGGVNLITACATRLTIDRKIREFKEDSATEQEVMEVIEDYMAG